MHYSLDLTQVGETLTFLDILNGGRVNPPPRTSEVYRLAGVYVETILGQD